MIRRNKNRKPLVGAKVNWAHPLARGLTRCYLMNEGAGNTVTDIALNKHGVAASTTWATGKFGKVLDFNGTSSIITTTDSYVCSGDFAISAWVYIKGNGSGYNNIWLVNNTPYRQVYVLNTTYALAFYNAAGGGYSIAATVTLNKWQHIGFSLTGTTATFFLDGVMVDTRTVTVTAATGVLNIGGFSSGFSNARIDNVRSYNRGLLAQEMQQLYSNPFADVQVTQRGSFNLLSSGNVAFSPRAPYMTGVLSIKG